MRTLQLTPNQARREHLSNSCKADFTEAGSQDG